MDEAFLDVSGGHRLFGSSMEIAEAIRARVNEDLKLSCSVGIARCKLLAKLASRAAKPIASAGGPLAGPGIVVVPSDHELEFLHPRPVSDLWGVGPRTAERLARYGIATIGDLARVDPAHLARLVGRAAGAQLHELAWARDDRPVVIGRPVKSVGHEETFAVDVHDPGQLRLEVARMADAVSSRLRASGLAGRTVTVKLRYGDFTTITRSHSLHRPVASSAELVKIAAALLSGAEVPRGASGRDRRAALALGPRQGRRRPGARRLGCPLGPRRGRRRDTGALRGRFGGPRRPGRRFGAAGQAAR